MKYLNNLLLSILVLLGVSNGAFAELIPIKDPDRKYEYYHVSYSANPDYTYSVIYEWAVKVLDKRALESIKKVRVSHSTSVEKIEILKAYNKKKDGGRIEAPKDNYQINTNKGRGEDGPVFSDISSVTVVLPEVEVGDTLVFSYKNTVNEPMFPGYFTATHSFNLNSQYDEVIIRLDVPEEFPGLHQAREMKEKIVKKDGRVKYQWSWKNKKPLRDSREDYSVWDSELSVGISYSTFPSYEAIAKAYGVRALPKTVVNDRVKKLADKIIMDEKDPREQARLLYEWVSTKITYAGNCVGVGAVVPHDVDFILDNHMGDCKDHATLLQSLLKYKGIKSEQALINSGSIYKLPAIPAVNSVNHVINYLPDYGLFMDSTSSDTPFGDIPWSIQGKPVLMVENFVEGMKTPSAAPGSNKHVLNADLKIDKDGSISGSVDVELIGQPAISARSGWRNVSKDSEEEWLKEIFTRNGKVGSATMKKDNPQPLLNSYKYKVAFNMKEFIFTDSAGAFAVYPQIGTYSSVDDMVNVLDQVEEIPIACSNGVSIETYTYEFPDGIKVIHVPNNQKIAGVDLLYESSYSLNENKLKVMRKIEDKTPGPICEPTYTAQQQKVLQKISRDLRQQVLYMPSP